MKQNKDLIHSEEVNATSTPIYSAAKSQRQDKRHRRYRKIGMHRLKSTHLLTEELIQAVS